jgi:UDP:flavonoid glycosyltransferase YjiC (YdhE family)
VCECLSPQTQVHFRTSVPQRFFREELGRPFEWSEAEFDCGCVQSDSVTVDVAATVDRYARIAARNAQLLESEAQWLQKQAFDAVVSDIPSFPLAAARAAGIPAVALGNFSWHDVYSEYTTQCPRVLPLLDKMAQEYGCADLTIEAAPALPMPYFRRKRIPVGIVGRPGTSVRDDLCATLHIPAHKRLALIYLGPFALNLHWERLAAFDDWVFLTAEPLAGAPPNIRVFDRARFPFLHVAASVDLVVSKLGYCTVTDCMVNGVPLLYVPRQLFAEYPALQAEVQRWGSGYQMADSDFRALNWAAALQQASVAGKPAPVEGGGAKRAAEAVESLNR